MTARLPALGGVAAALLACMALLAQGAAASPPPNDDFVDARVLSGSQVGTTGTLLEATVEPGEPSPSGGTSSIWYSWTAPETGDFTVDLCGSDFDTYLGVYTGDAIGSLATVGTGDDSLCRQDGYVTFGAQLGTTYRFMVDSYRNDQAGQVNLRLYPGEVAPLVHDFSVSKAGPGSGTVSSGPEIGIECGAACSRELNEGEGFILFARPDPGSNLIGWEGCSVVEGDRCYVDVTAGYTHVTAIFGLEPPGRRTLTVTKSGDGKGTVSSSPAGIECGAVCSAEFEPGSRVTLSPMAAAGSTFAGWSGDCAGTGPCTVTLDGDASVGASFAADAGRPPDGPPATSPQPLRVKLKKARLNPKKGTATLPVTVSAAARVSLSGRNVKAARANARGQATVKLRVAVKRKLKKRLRRAGKARARLTVKAVPGSGETVTRKATVSLKLKKKGRRGR